MPELGEQIRTLIDEVEPVGVADLVTLPHQRRRGARARLTLGLGAVAAALVVLALVVAGMTAPGNQGLGAQHFHWHLAGYTGPIGLSVQGAAGSGAYALQCPTTTTCYATEPIVVSQTVVPNGTVEVSIDGGQTWRSVLNAPGADLFGLTCPSEFTCAVTGEDFEHGSTTDIMYSTTDGGKSWAQHVIPGGSQGSSLLWCKSQRDCIATTTQVGLGGRGEQATALVTSDGGQSWTSAPFPEYFVPASVQCVGAVCVATGVNPPEAGGQPAVGNAAVAYSSDSGATWQVGRVPTADLVLALSCADASHCMANEETLLKPDSQRQFVPSSAIDTLISTEDGGATWTPLSGNEPETWLISGLDCPSALECWISGDSHPPGETVQQIVQSPSTEQGFVRVTTDGGQTWRSIPLPQVNTQSLTVIGNLSCPSSGTCFALANNPGAHAGPFPPEVVLSTATPIPAANSGHS
jgi:photosystem II stability/assembly factor-like uncharacterized protein